MGKVSNLASFLTIYHKECGEKMIYTKLIEEQNLPFTITFSVKDTWVMKICIENDIPQIKFNREQLIHLTEDEFANKICVILEDADFFHNCLRSHGWMQLKDKYTRD